MDFFKNYGAIAVLVVLLVGAFIFYSEKAGEVTDLKQEVKELKERLASADSVCLEKLLNCEKTLEETINTYESMLSELKAMHELEISKLKSKHAAEVDELKAALASCEEQRAELELKLSVALNDLLTCTNEFQHYREECRERVDNLEIKIKQLKAELEECLKNCEE